MAGAFLFGLEDEPEVVFGQNGADLFGLVADDNDDPFGRRQFPCDSDDVLDESQTAGAVEDLGLARLHARSEAGSQYQDG